MSGSEILFNSPALHCLKRSQLIKLCKRHGIKASGKNSELIFKLQDYARNADPATRFTAPSSDTGLDNDDDDNSSTAGDEHGTPRPFARPSHAIRQSEPWEVIEEDSREEENVPTINSQRSGLALSAIGEFGDESTAMPKSTSVSSSIKAFAQSLKRVAGSSQKSKGSSSDMPEEAQLIQEAPASVDETDDEEKVDDGPTPSTYCPNPEFASSTIRLISSASAENVDPSAGSNPSEVTMANSDGQDDDRSPASDLHFASTSQVDKRKSIYPELPDFALANVVSSASTMAGGFATTIPGAFPQAIASPSSDVLGTFSFSPRLKARASLNAAKPPYPSAPKPVFNFSSSSHTAPSLTSLVASATTSETVNATVVSSVLEEMNKRMGAQAGSSAALSLDLFDRTKGPMAAKPLHSAPKVEVKGATRFADLHQKMFDGMDSIASHYAARRTAPQVNSALTKKPKSSSIAPSKARTRPSISSTPGAARRRSRASASVATAAANKKANIGEGARRSRAFSPTSNDDDTDMEVDAGSTGPTATIRQPASTEKDAVQKKVSLAPMAPSGSKSPIIVKGSEAQKRKVAQSKAKRRSSAGRQSMGRESIVGASHAKPKAPPAGRFGFLKSGAKMLKNALIGGGDTKAKPSAPVKPLSTPKFPSVPSTVPGGWNSSTKPAESQPAKAKGSIFGGGLSITSFKSSAPKVAEPSTLNRKSSFLRKSSVRTGALSPPPTVSKPSTSSRKPSTVSSFGTARSVSASGGVGSMGRFSAATGSGSSKASGSESGKKAGPLSGPVPTPFVMPSQDSASTRKRPSTLTAPTASSLAKLQATVKPSQPLSTPQPQSSSLRMPKVFSPASTSPFNFSVFPPPSASTAPPKSTKPLGPITNTATNATTAAADEDTNDTDFGMKTSKSNLSTISSVGSGRSMSTTASGSQRRRPRVSRSKVIAKLDQKRAAAVSTPSKDSPSKRTSMTVAKAHNRRSLVIGLGASGATSSPFAARRRVKDMDVQMSAKKAFRRSEVARRKSTRTGDTGVTPAVEWGGVGTS